MEMNGAAFDETSMYMICVFIGHACAYSPPACVETSSTDCFAFAVCAFVWKTPRAHIYTYPSLSNQTGTDI